MKLAKKATTFKAAGGRGGLVRFLSLAVLLSMLAIAIGPATPTSAEAIPATPTACTAPGWQCYGVDAPPLFYNFTDRNLAFTSNNIPAIAYGGDHLYYAWQFGDIWLRIPIDNAPRVGSHAALAFNKNDRPFITYYDELNMRLKLAWYDGNSWHIEVIDYIGAPTSAPVVEEKQVLMSELKPEKLPADWASRPEEFGLEGGKTPEAQALSAGELGAAPKGPVSEDAALGEPDPLGVGLYTSIVIDSLNQVHISYYDNLPELDQEEIGKLKYAFWDGRSDNWRKEIVDHRNDVGSYSSIDLYFDDRTNKEYPGIAYMSEKYDDLKFAQWDGVQWTTEYVDEEGKVGPFASLAFDSKGNPHISYYDFTTSNKNLKYARRDAKGGRWIISVLDDEDDVGQNSSIAIDKNDVVYISYIDKTSGYLKFWSSSWGSFYLYGTNIGAFSSVATYRVDYRDRTEYYPAVATFYYFTNRMILSYLVWNGEKWLAHWVDGASDVGLGTSLALSPRGAPSISYFNDTNDMLKIARALGNTWSIRDVTPGFTMGMYASLKIDSGGKPHLAYYDNNYGDLIYTTTDINGNWIYTLVDRGKCLNDDCTLNEDVGQYVSLALDQSNNPHISYYDATNQDLKYAFITSGAWAKLTMDWTGDVGRFTSIVIGPDNRPAIAYYDFTNKDLKYLFKTPIDAWAEKPDLVDGLGDMGQFLSLAKDSLGNPHICYYDASNQDLKYAWNLLSSATPGWNVETVDFGAAPATTNWITGKYCSLAIDSANNPHISYYDRTKGDLKYAVKVGGVWTFTIVDRGACMDIACNITEDVGGFTSLALNQDGKAAISYYDYTNADLKLAMEYPLPPAYLFLPFTKKTVIP